MKLAISNDLSSQFNTQDGRKKLMKLFGNSEQMYFGVNENKEDIMVSIFLNKIVLRTLQKNGFVQLLYYDKNGSLAAESYDGKWNT